MSVTATRFVTFLGGVVALLVLHTSNGAEAMGLGYGEVRHGDLDIDVASSLSFANREFDDQSHADDLGITSAGGWWGLANGLTASYGALPSIGVIVSWKPGYTFPSRYAEDQKRRRDGPSNLRILVPVNFLVCASPMGETEGRGPSGARSKNGSFVLVTVAPIADVNIRGHGFESQSERRREGEAYTAEHPDASSHALGFALEERLPLGPRAELTAAQELLFYFPADYEEQSLANYDTNLVREGVDGAEPYDTIYYRYRAAASLGARYTLQEAPRSRWTAGLSLGGQFMPAPIVDDILVENTDSFLVSVEPSIALEPRAWNGRTSFELSWSIPVIGKNQDAEHEIALAIRTTLFTVGDEEDDGAGQAASGE